MQLALVVKNLPANARDTGLIPELRRSPGVGNGTLLRYSCLGNSMGRGTWRVIVHGVTKSWTRLSNWAQCSRGHGFKFSSASCQILGFYFFCIWPIRWRWISWFYKKMTAGKIFRKEKYDVSYPTVDKMRERRGKKKNEALKAKSDQEITGENSVLIQEKHVGKSNFTRVSFAWNL